MLGRGPLSTWNVPALTEEPATTETQPRDGCPAPAQAHLKRKGLGWDQPANSICDPGEALLPLRVTLELVREEGTA